MWLQFPVRKHESFAAAYGRFRQGRVTSGQADPRLTAPDTRPGQPRPNTPTVGLVLDTTANAAIFAIAAHADEREAHLREVERFGQNLPAGSYGRRNRQAIAARARHG